MNCCWIFLLLLCCGRGSCGSAVFRTSDNTGSGGRGESRNAESREQTNGCECEAVRLGAGMEDVRSGREDRDGCDIASTIPQPWQEYARRDPEDCQN